MNLAESLITNVGAWAEIELTGDGRSPERVRNSQHHSCIDGARRSKLAGFKEARM